MSVGSTKSDVIKNHQRDQVKFIILLSMNKLLGQAIMITMLVEFQM